MTLALYGVSASQRGYLELLADESLGVCINLDWLGAGSFYSSNSLKTLARKTVCGTQGARRGCVIF